MSKKNNHHLLGTIEKQALWAFRQFKKSQIVKEVKFYADGIVNTISRADILPNKKILVKEAKKNLEGFMKKVQGSQVLSSLLDFPSKKDVAKLNARLTTIEKRLKAAGHKRASA